MQALKRGISLIRPQDDAERIRKERLVVAHFMVSPSSYLQPPILKQARHSLEIHMDGRSRTGRRPSPSLRIRACEHYST